eukprot:gene20275-biopygen20563
MAELTNWPQRYNTGSACARNGRATDSNACAELSRMPSSNLQSASFSSSSCHEAVRHSELDVGASLAGPYRPSGQPSATGDDAGLAESSSVAPKANALSSSTNAKSTNPAACCGFLSRSRDTKPVTRRRRVPRRLLPAMRPSVAARYQSSGVEQRHLVSKPGQPVAEPHPRRPGAACGGRACGFLDQMPLSSFGRLPPAPLAANGFSGAGGGSDGVLVGTPSDRCLRRSAGRSRVTYNCPSLWASCRRVAWYCAVFALTADGCFRLFSDPASLGTGRLPAGDAARGDWEVRRASWASREGELTLLLGGLFEPWRELVLGIDFRMRLCLMILPEVVRSASLRALLSLESDDGRPAAEDMSPKTVDMSVVLRRQLLSRGHSPSARTSRIRRSPVGTCDDASSGRTGICTFRPPAPDTVTARPSDDASDPRFCRCRTPEPRRLGDRRFPADTVQAAAVSSNADATNDAAAVSFCAAAAAAGAAGSPSLRCDGGAPAVSSWDAWRMWLRRL